MPNIFAQPSWEVVPEVNVCSSCAAEGVIYTVHTARTIHGQQLKVRYYCSEFCQRTFETFLFRKSEASDERKRVFGKRAPDGLKKA